MKTKEEFLDDKIWFNSIEQKNAILRIMEEYAQEVAKNLYKPLVSGELPESERIYFNYRDENGEAQHGYMDKKNAEKTLSDLMRKEAIIKNIMKELEGNFR